MVKSTLEITQSTSSPLDLLALFLGLRVPLVTPLPDPRTHAKSLDSSVNHQRTTTDLSDIVRCISGGVWSKSGGVNVYRLIWPDLMYVGKYPFPVHVHDALMLLMQRC